MPRMISRVTHDPAPPASRPGDEEPYRGLEAAVLRRVFETWLPEVVDAFCRDSLIIHLGKGDYLGRTGHPCAPGLLIVLTGSVRAFHTQADGTEFTVNYLEPGHLIGLIPFFDGGDFMADYVGHEETIVAAVPREVFDAILERYPRVALDLLALLSRRIRMLHSTLENQSLLPAPRRLAARLDQLVRRYGRPIGDGILIDIKLSQDDLSMMLGVTRPTVAKELKALADCGIVRKAAYRQLIVMDPARLRAIAEQD